jgi:hypothetical protein
MKAIRIMRMAVPTFSAAAAQQALSAGDHGKFVLVV